MISYALVLFASVNLVLSHSCYWNDGCAYQLYSSKTPYDTVRGDVRDYSIPQNCKAISVWSLNRHGNRNPDSGIINDIKILSGLKDEIVNSFYEGRSGLCAQDIDDLKQWRWNETLEESGSYLTGVGYEELYDIGRRIRERYPQLLEGSEDQFYFRTTNEQRTVLSGQAFVHGLTEGTNLSLPIDAPWERDDVIRPYENCERYQDEVKGSQVLADQLDAYYKTPEFLAVKDNVQRRFGIATQLTADNIYTLYEFCRFFRSWQPDLRSPWCSAFTYEDLLVLEYRDDIRHYYRNGYGSSINVNLGGPVVKNLYESMEAVVQGRGKNVIAYFTHDTMIEMAMCAMGLFKDDYLLQAANRNSDRLWRTSIMSSFSSNILAVLNSCEESGNQNYRVQLFVNEKPTEICPLEGCEWGDFNDKFQRFLSANLDFCSSTRQPGSPLPGSGSIFGLSSIVIISSLIASLWVY